MRLMIAVWLVAAFGYGEETKLTAPERLPILAFGISEKDTTLERFQELREAGFTHSWWGWYSDAAALEKALDVAGKAGIKIVGTYTDAAQKPEEWAKRFAKHPALGGYYLGDEPNANQFAALGAVARRLQAVDRQHLTYVNLFPSHAGAGALGAANYQEHVDRFLKEFPVQILSFDHYPGWGNTYDKNWYEDLSLIAKSAKAANIPFWAFVLPTGIDSFRPTLATLRLEAFTGLAFGAQGIQHFGYWDWSTWDPRSNFHDAPIGVDGKRGPSWEFVNTVNREVIALSPVFLNSQVLDIGHTAALTLAGIGPYAPRSPVVALKSNARGALVALHANQKRQFLIVVNRDPAGPMSLALEFDGKRKISTVDKLANLHAFADKSHAQTLEPGDVAIYCWDAP